MRNAFLGKVRLKQDKVIFCLKVILKKPAGGAYMPPPVLNRVKVEVLISKNFGGF